MGNNTKIIIERFNKLIPDGESDLIILKGHLLVEEILEGILEYLSSNREYLKNTNLTFHQKLYLCGSLVSTFQSHLFKAIDRLNRIRNKLAHKLEPQDFDKQIDELIEMFEKDISFMKSFRREDKLKITIACICGNLSLIKDELGKLKSLI